MSSPFTLDQTFYDHGNANGDPELRGHTTDGGHVSGFTRARYVECDYYGCRAVLVLDPADGDQVEALRLALSRWGWERRARPLDPKLTEGLDLKYALRNLITPPRPDEPMGAGAVVVDSAGDYWIRVSRGSDGAVWHRSGTPPEKRAYANVAVATAYLGSDA